MVHSYHADKASPDVEVLSTNYPMPGYGLVPINAFVLKGSEPILVDTGSVTERADFMRALRSVIDPAALRWIWLTHTDLDHIGALQELLSENSQLRVITTFLGAGIMGLSTPLPLDRVYLVNPGEKVTLGSRTLTALKPPTFDNPCTTGFFDEQSGVLCSSDCFGALLSAVPQSAGELSPQELRDGQHFWTALDSPWLHNVDRSAFGRELAALRQLSPSLLLSSHLPPAKGELLEQMLENLAMVPDRAPFVGPNQAALEQMMKQMAAGAK